MKSLIKPLLLLLSAYAVQAQSFTNSTHLTIDGHTTVSNYEYSNNANHLTVDTPLYFWMQFNNLNNQGISAELNHRGVSYELFNDSFKLDEPLLIVGPINAFYGEFQSGNWQLKLHGEEMFISQWGIASTIPEPATMILFVFGCLLLKKYEKS